MKFHLSVHFCNRMVERGLSVEDVKAVIRIPRIKKELNKGKNNGKVTKFEKTVGGKTVVVIAEVRNAECWIMTAYES